MTGTSHLVAVSGQNVTMLAGLVIAALAWLVGRRPACWIALAAIGAYAVLAGAEASVVRAAIMGALYIASIALGRQSSGWVALVMAGAAMAALEPQIVHDVAFQLSFAAVLGLATLAAPLRERIEALIAGREDISSFPLVRPTLDILCMSLASVAFTLPISAVNFHQVSLVAPLANLFAVPAFVAVAASAALVATAGSVSPGLADLLAWLAWPPAAYMVAVVHLFGEVPAASLRMTGIGSGHAIAYYAGLGACLFYLLRRRIPLPEPALAKPRAVVMAPAIGGTVVLLALSAALVWLALRDAGGERLSVAFMDVGQGEAILIESPSGNRVLIDGGPSGEMIGAALGRRLPFYDERIDVVVATHPQADHLGGLPAVLERYEVGAVVQTAVEGDSNLSAAWLEAIARTGTRVISAHRGQLIDLGSGATLTLLNPTAVNASAEEQPVNDLSIVMRLDFGETSLLLTGDIGEDGEAALARMGTDLRADVLKVAHHGSRTSTSPEFLSRVRPQVAVISAGKDNRFGHPAPQVLDSLEGLRVYRTDEDGDIVVSTDGHNLWVKTQR